MLVGPMHTFKDLAHSIDAAFARWDLAHLHEYELADGRRIGYPDDEFDMPVIDHETLTVASCANEGDEFAYVFDLGDDWRHRCLVDAIDVDPKEAYGVIPGKPVPIWGWGWIPDQYGRRWDGDTGED